MEPVKPRPPAPLPPRRLDYTELPHDGQNERDYIMSSKIGELKGKTLLKSRTIVSIALSIVGFVVVNLLGLDVDLGAFVEAADGLQLGELILVIGGVIAAYFRKNARAGIPQSEG